MPERPIWETIEGGKPMQALVMTGMGMTQEEICRELSWKPLTLTNNTSLATRSLGAKNIFHALVIAEERGYLKLENLVPPDFGWKAIHLEPTQQYALERMLDALTYKIGEVSDANFSYAPVERAFMQLVPGGGRIDRRRGVAAMVRFAVGKRLHAFAELEESFGENLRTRRLAAQSKKDAVRQAESPETPSAASMPVRRDARSRVPSEFPVILNPRTTTERVDALKRIREGKGCAIVAEEITVVSKAVATDPKLRILAVGGDTVFSLLNTVLEQTNTKQSTVASIAGACILSIANGNIGPFVDIPIHNPSGEKGLIRVYLINGWNTSPIHKSIMERYMAQLETERTKQQEAS